MHTLHAGPHHIHTAVQLFAAGFTQSLADHAWKRRGLLLALAALRWHWRRRAAQRRKKTEAILALRYLNLAGVHRIMSPNRASWADPIPNWVGGCTSCSSRCAFM